MQSDIPKTYKMPCEVELDAVKENFVELMKLPVKDLLPALKAVIVCEYFVVTKLVGKMADG